MASYMNAFVAALRTAVRAAWPEVTSKGIFRSREMTRTEWEKLAAPGGHLPLAVVDWDLHETAEWGADNEAEEGLVYFFYVANDSVTPPQLDAKLEALRDELYDNGLTVGQIQGYPEISTSSELAPNRYFENAKKPFYAGLVTARVLVGDSPE